MNLCFKCLIRIEGYLKFNKKGKYLNPIQIIFELKLTT